MPAVVTLHEINNVLAGGTVDAYVLLRPGIYTADIATATGISDVSSDRTKADNPVFSVAELLKKGVLIRLKTYSTVNGKQYTHSLLVTRDKLGTVQDRLKGKSISGKTIERVGFSRNATYT